jgi:hypothetical protein
MAGEEKNDKFWREEYRMCKLLRLFEFRMTTFYFCHCVFVSYLLMGRVTVKILPKLGQLKQGGFFFFFSFVYILFCFVLLSCMSVG